MIDLLGHLGYLILTVGTFLIGRRHSCGWLCRAAGDALWCGLGIALGMSSIFLWGIVFLVVDFLGWRATLRQSQPQKEPAP